MNTSLFGRVWAWVKWPLFVLVFLFVAGCIYFISVGGQIVRTREAVAKIHATRLTWSDINSNLPAQPDVAENNQTLAGVDANNNGIRDDVEIAIYNKYKNDWRIAIPELQYAKELQMEFTQVYNSDTLIAVLQEEGRGFGCVYNSTGAKDLKTLNANGQVLIKEVENLVFNNQARKDAVEALLQKYMKGYALLNGEDCDIDPSTYAK